MNPLTAVCRLVRRPYASLPAPQAAQLVADGALLIDVRDASEWRAGHVQDARHLPLDQLPARISELPANRTIVTVCRSGVRSARAARQLARAGHTVANLRGGLLAWQRSGLPLTRTGGRPGRVA